MVVKNYLHWIDNTQFIDNQTNFICYQGIKKVYMQKVFPAMNKKVDVLLLR